MPTFASLAEVKAEIKANSTVDDAKLMANIREVSGRIDRVFQQRRPMFFPWIESRQIVVDSDTVNTLQNTIRIHDNLLALVSVSLGDSALTINTDVELWPSLQSPAHNLRLMDRARSWYADCSGGTKPLIVTINGVWGFHRDYPNAWLAVDVSAAIATTSATTFTVADVDGLDEYNRTPRISAGNLIQIDDELMDVVKTDTGTNTVTVRRGVHGSTAATHLVNAVVKVWQVEEPVKRACERQAAFMYARRGAYESATITDIGVESFPSDLLGEVRGMVQAYAYE